MAQMRPLLVALLARLATAQDIEINRIENPGVILYKTSGPLPEQKLGDDFPGDFPARFMRQAWGLEGPRSPEGKSLVNATGVCTTEAITDEFFGQAMLERAKAMFDDRNLRHELDAFLQSGVSNTDSPSPRRMYWVGIHILPNQSLALHSHPNVEFVYVAAGVMHEWRCPKCPVKRSYVPERIETNGKTIEKYWGPDLHKVNAKAKGMFRHDAYNAGDMFINAIGDVHQSYTEEEGVKLLVMWGDGNADVPLEQLPRHSDFLNVGAAKAWD